MSSQTRELKESYYSHFKTINPNGALEATYRNSLFYYDAELLPLLPIDKSISILEIGCGFGHLLRYLADHKYINIGGVEIDANLYAEASAYLGNTVSFLECTDAFKFLENKANAFDVIILFDVIEHFPQEQAISLTKKIFSALKIGGKVIYRTPNMANFFGVYSRYIDLTHFTAFTEYSLLQLYTQAGFNKTSLHLPQWDKKDPRTRKLKISSWIHKTLFKLQDRAMPRCFEKNIVMVAYK